MIYRFFRFLFRVLFKTVYRVEIRGLERIPETGPVVLCGNHTSLLDPPIMGVPLERKVHYMAKAELFETPVIGPIIKQLGAFPVKRGGVSKETIRLAIRLLQDGNVMGIFPEGTRKNPGMGKKGAASLALKSGAAVIPVAIIGDYSLFRKMKVVYGEPVDLSEYRDDKTSEALEAATEKIMKSIYELLRKEA